MRIVLFLLTLLICTPIYSPEVKASSFPVETCKGQGINETQAQRVFTRNCGLTFDAKKGHSCNELNNDRWECRGSREVCSVKASSQPEAEKLFKQTCGIAYDKEAGIGHDCRPSGRDVICSGGIVPGTSNQVTSTPSSGDSVAGKSFPVETCSGSGINKTQAERVFLRNCGIEISKSKNASCSESSGRWTCKGSREVCSVKASSQPEAEKLFEQTCGVPYNKEAGIGHDCRASGRDVICSGGIVVGSSNGAPSTPVSEPEKEQPVADKEESDPQTEPEDTASNDNDGEDTSSETICSAQASSLSNAKAKYEQVCGTEFKSECGQLGNMWSCSETDIANPHNTGGDIPDVDVAQPSGSFDNKHASNFGSEGLVFKRAFSSGLCQKIASNNGQYASQSEFTVNHNGKNYKVFNVVQKFGVQPNGSDQRSKIENALNAVGGSASNPEVLYFPTINGNNTYGYKGTMETRSSNAVYCGGGSTLKALDGENSTLTIKNNNVHVVGFRFIGPAGARNDWPERLARNPSQYPGKTSAGNLDMTGSSMYLTLAGSQGTVIAGNHMLGSRGGLRLYHAKDISIYDNHVERTVSDSIHIVHASQNVIVANNRIINSGDDCISVVLYSYQNRDLGSVDNVLVENNTCIGGRGRGLTIIGGKRVTLRGNYLKDIQLNGILIFPANKHSLHNAEDILVTQNFMEDVVQTPESVGFPYRGSIGLMGGINDVRTNYVQNIMVYKNIVVDRDRNTQSLGKIHLKHKPSDSIRNVTFEKNELYGPTNTYSGKTSDRNIRFIDNVDSSSIPGNLDRSKYGSSLK